MIFLFYNPTAIKRILGLFRHAVEIVFIKILFFWFKIIFLYVFKLFLYTDVKSNLKK
jgi:hypothetical protein